VQEAAVLSPRPPRRAPNPVGILPPFEVRVQLLCALLPSILLASLASAHDSAHTQAGATEMGEWRGRGQVPPKCLLTHPLPVPRPLPPVSALAQKASAALPSPKHPGCPGCLYAWL